MVKPCIVNQWVFEHLFQFFHGFTSGKPTAFDWSLVAQLKQLNEYIAKDSPMYALKFTEAMVKKSMALGDAPHLGPKIPELNDEAVREIPAYAHRLIYEIKADRIEILAVIHKRRDLVAEDIPRE